MGGGCTHVIGELVVVGPGEGTDCSGSFEVAGSWARAVPAHATTDSRAVPAEIRMRVWLFTVLDEAYHCFSLLWSGFVTHALNQ